jgi:GLPGLI family protein
MALAVPPKTVYQYKNLSKRFIQSAQSKELVLKDSIIGLKWKISNEKKKIGSVNCKKAIGILYGRNYEVWYAPEIPISSGPWKFYGLPGLILEAIEINGNLKFAFVSLDMYNKINENISIPNLKKGQRIVNKAEYLKLIGKENRKNQKPVIISNKDGDTIIKNTKGLGLEIWD